MINSIKIILNQIKQISKASKIAYVEIKDRLIEFLNFFNNVETYAASLSLYSLSTSKPPVKREIGIIQQSTNTNGKNWRKKYPPSIIKTILVGFL